MAIVGNAAANLLLGTQKSDEIKGLGGDDTIFARAGSDTVLGGTGDDRLAGGEGGDRLFGGDGNDVIFGFGSQDRSAAASDIAVDRIGTVNFERPVFACAAPGDPDRLYVVEQHSGRIVILDTGSETAVATPFLDIPDAELAQGNEQGLLGLAFDPDYATNRKFYVYLTNAAGDIEVRSYLRSVNNPDAAVAGSGNLILTIDKDNGAGNHNGGWIAFGPDGLLYIAVGDEGLAGDPSNNAQNINSLWGKILRVDVSGDDFPGDPNRDYVIPDGNPFAGAAGADEIFALGLRNPWRASFDRVTGDFYIGDVGQNALEEINYLAAGTGAGANFGWKVKEGTSTFDSSVPGNPPPTDPALIDPVAQYGHDANGGFAVTGGYVYRGPAPGMQGRYVYADYVSGKIWSLRIVDGEAVDVTEHTAQLTGDKSLFSGIASFAEDGAGNLYAISLSGAVMRLDFGAASGDGSDLISGGAGADRLYGGGGNDTVKGGTGSDKLFGGQQNDILLGGDGNDTVHGNGGADRIDGGAGDNRLAGGSGEDVFVFGSSLRHDTITDFRNNVDTIRIADAYGFTSASQALALAAEVSGDVVFTFAGGQTLTVLDITKAALADDILV